MSPQEQQPQSPKLTPSQEAFVAMLKRLKALKTPDDKPVFTKWKDLADEDFCKEMLYNDSAVLKESAVDECKKENPDWASIVEDVDEEFLLDFQNWINDICVSGIHVTVSVGYAWDSKNDVRKDDFWCSLREILTDTTKRLQEFYEGSNVFIRVKRLRASHGGLINRRIVEYIENSDVLVFDIAGRKDLPEGAYTNGYNANVLYELGQAMAKKKAGKIFLWKPEELKEPSDLSCYLWTDYELKKGKNGKMTRTLVDRRGFSAQFRSVLVECVRKKLRAREKTTRAQLLPDSPNPAEKPATRIVNKLVEVLSKILQKTYVLWDKKKGSVPVKCVSFLDPKLAKLRAMSEKKQVAVVFGSLGAAFLLYFVAFSGGNDYEDMLEEQAEMQKAHEEKRLAEAKATVEAEWKEVLGELREINSISGKVDKVQGFPGLKSLIKRGREVGADFSVEEAKMAFLTIQNGKVKVELAEYLLSEEPSYAETRRVLGITDEWARANAYKYLEEGCSELSLKEREFRMSKDFLEKLPEKTLRVIAELGNSQAFGAYLEKQKEISLDKGVDWLVSIAGSADAAGNVYSAINRLTSNREMAPDKEVECLMKIVKLPDFTKKVLPDIINLYWDFPVVRDYIDQNFGAPAVVDAIREAGVKGEAIIFANKVKNNETIDLLESAKNLLVGMSHNTSMEGRKPIYLGDSEDPEKEILFKNTSKAPTPGHKIVMQYLIEAEKNGNQDATKILDAYSIKFGKKYFEDFPFFEIRDFKKCLARDLASKDIRYLRMYAGQTGKASTEKEYYKLMDKLPAELPAMSQSCVDYFLEKAPDLEKKFSFETILDLKLRLVENKSINEESHDKLMRDLFRTILSNQEHVWEILGTIMPTHLSKNIISVMSKNLSVAKEIGGDSALVSYVELLGSLDSKDKVKAKSLIVGILNKTDDFNGVRALVCLSRRQDFFSVVNSINKKEKADLMKNHVAVEALEVLKRFCDANLAKGKRKEAAAKFFILEEGKLPKNPIHGYFVAFISKEAVAHIIHSSPHATAGWIMASKQLEKNIIEYACVVKAGLLNVDSEYYNGGLQTATEDIYFSQFLKRTMVSSRGQPVELKSVELEYWKLMKGLLDAVKNRKSYAPYLDLGKLVAEKTDHIEFGKACLDVVVKNGTRSEKESVQSFLEKL